MDSKILLEKLQSLYIEKNTLQTQDNVRLWASKVAPILKFVDSQYYVNFLEYAHRFNLPLSSYTLEPAFDVMCSQIEMAIEELKLKIEAEESMPDEMYFPENSFLDIQKNIARVLRLAQDKLFICDPYMDETIVEELSEVSAMEFRLLCKVTKGLFLQRLEALKKQFHTKKIEARLADNFHDRFFIIDESEIRTLGASLNKAGKKATILSRIKNDVQKSKLIQDFTVWWENAQTIK